MVEATRVTAMDADAAAPCEEARAAGEDMPAVDVVFGLSGTRVPADHAFALAREVARCLPWFDDEPRAGIHPLRAAASTHGMLVLARRARLVLRVPAALANACVALSGQVLDIAGEAAAVGEGAVRPLAPSTTLYAQRVMTGARDERAFHDDVVRWLADIEVPCEFISGRVRTLAFEGREVAGYGLALHGLAAADSLRVQRDGMGGHRRLGCGIFVPHKAIAIPP